MALLKDQTEFVPLKTHMCSMIVEKKLMQKHPTDIMITTNMHADNTCCVQYLVLAPKPQYKYDCNNK